MPIITMVKNMKAGMVALGMRVTWVSASGCLPAASSIVGLPAGEASFLRILLTVTVPNATFSRVMVSMKVGKGRDHGITKGVESGREASGGNGMVMEQKKRVVWKIPVRCHDFQGDGWDEARSGSRGTTDTNEETNTKMLNWVFCFYEIKP
ncbi:hypothetical protein L1987_57406 [Smallanthus sonchifolius]|uniref:Uncharacterized protein n=1 Tax=Smallanthus sonchifolius TaxID=185202 RepID=A0ACB9DDE1_9ASTR|nr:hypothetical protein L1987_57406 [Smallanthus sonchifolius]